MLEKYTTTELAAKDEKEADKTILSTDFYAVCEFLNDLKNKIEHLRMEIK